MKAGILSMLICCLSVTALYAQETSNTPPAEDTVAPYLKYPTLPAFNVLMTDSTTIFNTYNIPEGRPIALFFFSPDCSHCRRTTERITMRMDSLKDIDFYMITPVHSMKDIKDFYDGHNLGDFPNVKLIGRDYEFFFGSYYKVRYVPDIALYDAHKKLIKLIQGETNVTEIYKAVHGN